MGLVDPALEYFVAVYETGSVNGAARRLFIAGSAISRQLARLERELDTALFERLPTGLKATAAGNAFAAYARRTIAEAAEIASELRAGEASSIVSIAGSEGTVHELLPAVAARASLRYPKLRIRLRRATASAVSEMVRDGVVDLGVTFNLSLAAGVQVRHAFGAPVHALLRPGHPLAGKAGLSFQELSAFPLVLSPQGATSRALVDAFAARIETSIDPVFETDDTAATIRFVTGTDAVALLSRVSLGALDAAAVATVPMREPEFQARSIQVQIPVGRALHPAAEVLAGLVVETLEQASGA